jgi:phosphoribosylformylglycinamidine synthase subunit PurQ / glutaminase
LNHGGKPVGILRFLGTNCDADVVAACDVLKIPNKYIWWADRFNFEDYSAFVLPGGFSYGDYLRAGAMAARTPAMDDVRKGALAGYPILGICNGFQILCESELLPGVLTKNISQSFQDEWVELEELKDAKKKYRLPIAHSMGRFYATDEKIQELFDQDQVWLKYSSNPNGSLRDIAGITNEMGNVRALMPHPERAMFDWMGSSDGRSLFEVFCGK